MLRLAQWLALVPLAAWPSTRAVDLARAIRETGLNADECYRVRDLSFSREDVRLYLTDGYLIFAHQVNQRRVAAVFTAAHEGGDAEALLMPPRAGERLSLASFTGSPNLSEHFRYAVMIFADDTGALLADEVRRLGSTRSPEMGLVLAGDFSPVLRNLTGSFEVRLVQELLSDPRTSPGFFYATLSGVRLGNFDVMVDPQRRDQVNVGQVSYRDNRVFFDTWTSFESRGARAARAGSPVEPPWKPMFQVERVRLDASLAADLTLKVTTRFTMQPEQRIDGPIPFEISRQMRIAEAKLDGEPVEVFQRESLRAHLIRGRDSDVFLVVPPKPLEIGARHEIEFQHEGAVVAKAADGIYYVSARGNWYPYHGVQYANFDLTFRYPRELDLVATGQVVEDRTEGDLRVTRSRTSAPVRVAAFNLGDYHLSTVKRGGLTVEVYANRKLEPALRPRPRDLLVLQPPLSPFPRNQRRPDLLSVPLTPEPPDPTARLERFAAEIASGFEFMAAHFGPPPLETLKVSPVSGGFGQGFPGMVYLSTLSYLDARDRPSTALSSASQTFYSELLHAHETAHQWWGNVVASAGYKDDWLMEALANYSALLHLERRKGARAIDSVLEAYKENLLRRDEHDRTAESAGPVTWGLRLHSSHAPFAWRTIVYEKGSWIIHMLRKRLGDAQFLKMLGEVCRRHRNRALTTAEFRAIAAEFLPKGAPDSSLESFFESWAYSTGIPTLALSQSVSGKAPAWKVTGKVTQSGVGDDFAADVPVVIEFAGGRTQTHWVRTANEPVEFNLPLRARPVKVSLDPAGAVLAIRK